VPVSCQVLAGAQRWQIVYEAKGNATSEKLSISHAPDPPNEYLYAKPANATVRKLAGKEAAIPFAGSDFWLSDLGLEFLHWPKQRLVKTDMRSSRWCNVLESINPTPGSGNYLASLSWLDKESGAPIMAEGYNAANQRVKEFAIKSVWRRAANQRRSRCALSRQRAAPGFSRFQPIRIAAAYAARPFHRVGLLMILTVLGTLVWLF